MKMKTLRRKPASIAKTRWAAYAAAGAATAFAGTNSAEAVIHYSGILNEPFPPHKDKAHKLHLDQAGDSLFFQRTETSSRGQGFDAARVFAYGIVSAGVKISRLSSSQPYAAKLSFGQNISGFLNGSLSYGLNIMESIGGAGTYKGGWGGRGTGYVGFMFNNGAGRQIGWARVRMTGVPENGFKIVDYAYGDPGEPVTAGEGQSSSNEQAPDQGSLGWLAAGAAGLIAWRKSRPRTARYTRPALRA